MIKSYCKINLFLRVLKKTHRDLHDIQTTAMLLDLHDKIRIKEIKKNKDEVLFTGLFKENINNKTNSVINTLSILRSQNFLNTSKKYQITINKRIPVFAGLGGGTGNAVSIIKYFVKSKISLKLIEQFENKIGSDLRLFFFNHTFQKTLKNVRSFKKKYNFHFLLVYPNVKSSTKIIFSKVKNFNKPLRVDPLKISSKKKYIKFLINETNDLQKIVEKKHKKIKDVLNLIKLQKNCLFSRMTGSGSVCFGVFSNRKSASMAFKVLKKKFPNYWCVLTKSI
jgi:4-diphosphocytidyl-2-C-methyl-D-erythritol kinase|tara:strand:+ start:1694 stop:2533 length:840 start_codon:yes stop_codon:yes gene_type:complete